MLTGTVNSSIHQQNHYETKTENRRELDAVNKPDNTLKAESPNSSGTLSEPHDKYIPSGDDPGENLGIYRLEKDENGRQKIVFDRPDSPMTSERSDTVEKKANGNLPEVMSDQTQNSSPEKKDGPKKSGDKKEGIRCTVNTDQVDAEIRKLKAEEQKLEQQLKSTRDNDDKRKELEDRLSQVESELSAKDNDAYRKQHATYTYS